MRLRRREAPQLGVLGALALAATLLSVAAGAGGASHADGPRAAASAWRGLVGTPRQQVAVGQRVIVVLNSPSLSDRVAAAGGTASETQQRQWTASALAADRLLIARLAQEGVKIKPEHEYSRVLTGFSAPLDPRAVALLERTPEVAGVYPVRIAYPASVSSTMIDQGKLAAGSGSRPNVFLPGFDGRGVTIALLDTGLESRHPYLLGQVGEGYDVVDMDDDPSANASPEDPTRLERHGTQLAGLMVGSEGPAGLNGVARGASMLPIRVAGWQREASGRWAVFGRTDQLIAGLERAVDPNDDGVALDAARVALVGVAEPFASFEDSASARAVAGALRLDTLVVAPGGNDGIAGPGYGSIAGPGGSRAALTVGAADLRDSSVSVHVVIRAGLGVFFDRRVPLVGAVAPRSKLYLRLGAPRLERTAITDGTPPKLSDFFDEKGFSHVAGRAALVPAGARPRLCGVTGGEGGREARRRLRRRSSRWRHRPGRGGRSSGRHRSGLGRTVRARRVASRQASARLDRHAQRRSEQSRGTGGALLVSRARVRRLRQAGPRRPRSRACSRRTPVRPRTARRATPA